MLFIGTPFSVTHWRILSSGEGLDYAKDGYVVGPTSFLFSEFGVVYSGSKLLGGDVCGVIEIDNEGFQLVCNYFS